MMKRLKTRLLLILFLVAIGYIFLISNFGLRIFYGEKVWVHRVNSIEKLDEVKDYFSGVELDVVFDNSSNSFDVNHPPAKSVGLTLSKYLMSVREHDELKLWLDFKNLDSTNVETSANKLMATLKRLKLTASNIIVESSNPELLKKYSENGFLVSYYLPVNLYQLDEQKLAREIEILRRNLSAIEVDFISDDHRNYAIMRNYFPDAKKITWVMTGKGIMGKIRTNLRLYRLLSKDDVQIALITVKSEQGDR